MLLPAPPAGSVDATASWVAAHLGALALEGPGGIAPSTTHRGGQAEADAALDAFDVAGYASRRSTVLPVARRGASALSPWIRHGLLPLPRVWDHVAGGPLRDVRRFRDELLWQEHARHLYARVGAATGRELRAEQPPAGGGVSERFPWPVDMACAAAAATALEEDGWVVNQARMWLASLWAVRAGATWQEGEHRTYQHLLDGSRAANRLGWQWVAGTATGRPYGVSRRQVATRAPELCRSCPLQHACPIEAYPEAHATRWLAAPPSLRRDPDPDATAGPAEVVRTGTPEVVWLTAESLGDADPALAAHPDLPAAFCFDEALLGRLRLSGKRLVFLAECLAWIARRPAGLEVHRGDPVAALDGRPAATTAAPVPGGRRLRARASVAELHPWPWLVRPGPGPVTSFSAWRKAVRR